MRQSNGGRRAARTKRYSSLSGFYNDDSSRVRSAERDVGLWWREGTDGPLHRAAWVAETGELYLVRLGAPERGGGAVEVLATIADREQMEDALNGWREQCGEPRSLAWLRARAARLHSAELPACEQGRRPHASVGADAGAMLAAMSSLTSELARESRRRTRASAVSRPRRPQAGRVAASSSSA
jgi:hypothetical protein